jgi:hypothetical protein
MGFEIARLGHGKPKLDALDYTAGAGLIGSAGFGSRFGYEYFTRSWEDIDTAVSAGALISALILVGALGALSFKIAATPRSN